MATYSCGVGYILTGSATRFCGSEGIWLPAAPTCDRKTHSDHDNDRILR